MFDEIEATALKKRKEVYEMKWRKMSLEERIEELKKRVDDLEAADSPS